MSSTDNGHEASKLREVARDYGDRGYRVSIAPDGDSVPGFLRDLDYRPDLLAESEHEKVVVEVRSRESIRGDSGLASVSKAIEDSGEWTFVLVYTNPKSGTVARIPPPRIAPDEIEGAARYALALVSGSNDAYAKVTALLLAWSTVEAALRSLTFEGTSLGASSPRALVRDAAMMGLIGTDAYERVIRIVERRDRAAHGDLQVEVSRADVELLVEVSREIVRYGEPRIARGANG